MPQRRIQEWIERMPRHIQRVIELKGDNVYREGVSGGNSDIRPYDRVARKEAYRRRKAGIRPGSEPHSHAGSTAGDEIDLSQGLTDVDDDNEDNAVDDME